MRTIKWISHAAIFCSVLVALSFSMSLHAAADNTSKKTPSKNSIKWEEAVLAGGCFWCMEPPFEKLSGVKSVVSGYTGGEQANPSYSQVAQGKTKHTEAVKVTFNPAVISYEEILKVFWMNIDPTDNKGQFVDRGMQYRPGIFYASDAQKKAAEKSKKSLAESKRFAKPIVVEITKLKAFYPAEDYHQDFYKKNPPRYNSYRKGSGRDDFIKAHWGRDKS